MHIDKKKIAAVFVTLFLAVSFASALAVLPVEAHDPPWTIPTNAYLIATPNPVGVGQSITFVMWVDQNSPIAGGNQGPMWEGYKLDITKPDGSKQTLGPMTTTSATGSHWANYTPDQVGTYTVVFSWPGQTLTADKGIYQTGGIPYIGDFFAGSTSAPFSLIVQDEAIEMWQEPPLPTEYWQRPIHGANRGWSTLASSWLKGSWLVNDYQRAGSAPESPHILWTQPMTPGIAGGINDAQWPGIPTNVHDYEDPFAEPIVMNGKIYHKVPQIATENTLPGYYCRDLYTGEIIWFKNGTDNGLDNPYTLNTGLGSRAAHLNQEYAQLEFGQLYHYHAANGEGILAYLWLVSDNTWYMLDAYTGNWVCTLINVPSGTSVTDQDGSLLRYSYNSRTGRLLCWNSSQSIPPSAPFGTGQQQWKIRLGATIDAVNDTFWTEMGVLPGFEERYDEIDILPRSGYTMNLTIPTGLAGITEVLQDENRVPKMIFGSSIQNLGSGLGTAISADTFKAWAARIDEHVAPYSPYPNRTNTQNTNLGFGVTMLWSKDFTVPLPGKNYTWSIPGGSVDYMSKTFALYCKQTFQLWGYSLETGNLLWGPTKVVGGDMRYYSTDANSYDGLILTAGYGGAINCIDALTGEVYWVYNATSVGGESPYGNNYPVSIEFVADGKIYLKSTEHSPTKPLWRGSYLRCINWEDGTEIWKLLDYKGFSGAGTSLSDGIIVSASIYNNEIIAVGKGPSATTVTVQDDVVTLGDSVLLKGMVTDISPGTKQLTQTARFPKGVPAIADDDMQAWMEYLYMQQAKPADADGVEVVLSVVDANGNYRDIGTTTSDANGFYSFKWVPDIEGKYTVYARFAGSKSYWPSTDFTAFQVDAAPEATVAPTPAPASLADQYLLPGIGGIIAAIAIVGAIVVLMLRKK